jgi:hypothetical protein
MDTPIARAERREEELRGQLKEARVAMVQAHENWELAEREKMSQARSYWLEFQDASDRADGTEEACHGPSATSQRGSAVLRVRPGVRRFGAGRNEVLRRA